jgi:2-methylcitrate dehydratase PrpD
LAAQAAAVGVTGSIDVLDGEVGMGRAMGDNPDWSKAAQGLGEDFNITRMTFKNHACCGHTFSPIDGALAVQRRLAVAAQDIERVEVATYGPALVVAGNPAPRTAAEARFSIPFVVATALRFGRVRLAAFGPERLQDGEMRALMDKIHMRVDPQLDAAFPSRRGATVTMTCRDGRSQTYSQEHRVGDPELPLSDEELSDKFRELAVPVIGAAQADGLLRRIWTREPEQGL